MAKRDLSKHQRSIVKRYYEHRDTIMENKLSELVSEIYLCDSQKKADKLWKSVETALANLAKSDALAKSPRAKAILEARDVAKLAELIGELGAS